MGFVMGNLLVFVIARQFSKTFEPFLHRKTQAPKKKMFSVQRLNQMKHPEYLAFFSYLIPGIPNGVLPYVFAASNITFGRYLLSITAASVPSIFLWTWLGERLSKGDYGTAIILAALLAAVVVVILIFKKKIMAKIQSLE